MNSTWFSLALLCRAPPCMSVNSIRTASARSLLLLAAAADAAATAVSVVSSLLLTSAATSSPSSQIDAPRHADSCTASSLAAVHCAYRCVQRAVCTYDQLPRSVISTVLQHTSCKQTSQLLLYPHIASLQHSSYIVCRLCETSVHWQTAVPAAVTRSCTILYYLVL
jgi:hypothetical protein